MDRGRALMICGGWTYRVMIDAPHTARIGPRWAYCSRQTWENVMEIEPIEDIVELTNPRSCHSLTESPSLMGLSLADC